MLRSSRTKRRPDEGRRGVEPVDPFVSAIDSALTSLGGRTRVSGSTAVAMFALLDAAIDPVPGATVESLVRQALDDARRQVVVPTTALADRLLDLRSAATTGTTAGCALVAGSG